MIESNLAKPKTLEEYVLENNAMLQQILFNQASLMELTSQAYTYAYKASTARFPDVNNPREERFRSEQWQANFEGYKQMVAKIYEQNLKTTKLNVPA